MPGTALCIKKQCKIKKDMTLKNRKTIKGLELSIRVLKLQESCMRSSREQKDKHADMATVITQN